MTLRKFLVIGAVACALAAAQSFAANSILPPWFPQNLFTINPDNMTVEDFGSDTFKVGKTDDPQTV